MKALSVQIFLSIILLLSSCQFNDQAGNSAYPHYEAEVLLDPENQSLKVEGELVIPAIQDTLSELTFFLHKQLEITSLKGPGIKGFNIDSTSPSGFAWLPDAARIIVDLDQRMFPGEKIKIKFEYQGIINQWTSYSANRLTAGWVEMGIYFPWFLHNADFGDFTYRVTVDCPAQYKVTGLNETFKSGNKHILKSSVPVNDIVIAASPEMKTYSLQAEDTEIRFHYISLDDSLVVKMARDYEMIINHFTSLFGPVRINTINMVQSPRSSGGGYARLGGVVLGDLSSGDYDLYYQGYQRYFAHELAHLWWHKAPTDSWEDWINEGFAEYSALQYLRDQFGEELFDKWIASKKQKIENTPPVWELNRHDLSKEENFAIIEAVLYSKGPLILASLENRIGRDAYLQFCKQILAMEKPLSTDIISALEQITDSTTAIFFKDLLMSENIG